ncbi:hypothetical protein NT07LI_3779, partial [Listeria innocua FSL S4-378]
ARFLFLNTQCATASSSALRSALASSFPSACTKIPLLLLAGSAE